MSMKFNYDGTNNILLGNAGTLIDAKESVAVDALRVIFQGIHESSERLEQKVLQVSLTADTTDNSRSNFYSSVISEAWLLIDGIRRLEPMLKYISGIPETLNNELEIIFNEIRLVRNSFQHVDERISSHFAYVGGSVFGDLIWRFREEQGNRETLTCLISGVSRHKRHTELGIGPEISELIDKTGVYDAWLIYIKKDSREIRVSIDEAVAKITLLLDFLEEKYSRQFELLDITKQTYSMPYVFRLRVTKEAFDKVNKS